MNFVCFSCVSGVIQLSVREIKKKSVHLKKSNSNLDHFNCGLTLGELISLSWFLQDLGSIEQIMVMDNGFEISVQI